MAMYSFHSSLLPCSTDVAMIEAKEDMPEPSDILGELAKNKNETFCLRARPQYKDLIANFAKCVCFASVFRKHCTHSPISRFMPPHLEAYMVLVYANHYDNWMGEFSQKDDATSTSDLSNLSNNSSGSGGKYTNKSKGKHKGWSEDGIKLYNNMVERLKCQRADTRLGKEFDEDMLQLFIQMRGGKGKDGDQGGATIAALNGIEDWQMYQV